MKSIAAIAVMLVYLVSFVTADHQPSTVMTSDPDNQFSEASDRMQLAKTIKEMLSNNPEAGLASTMSTEDLFGLLTRVATTPGVLSNAAGIISAVRSGNTGAIAGHVVNLLGAALPAVLPTPAPVPATPVLPLTPTSVIAPISTPATPSIPISPIVVPSTNSAPIAPAVAALPSTSA